MDFSKPKKKLGEILLEHKSITQEQLDEALKKQQEDGGLLGEILIRMNFVEERAVLVALAEQVGVPYLSVHNYVINANAFKSVPVEMMQKYVFIPIDKVGNVISLVMCDPTNEELIKEIERITPYALIEVLPQVIDPGSVKGIEKEELFCLYSG